MSPQNNHLQRPPAAVLYADELAKLKQNDNAPCPPGWQLRKLRLSGPQLPI